MTAPKNRKQRRGRIGLSRKDENKLREKLLKTLPSEPWFYAQIKTFDDTDARGEPIVYRFHDARVFPPGGNQTLMVECPLCGRTVPPNSLEDGVCMDHASDRAHECYGPSPSAKAIEAIQMRNLRVEGIKIKKESKKALKREIKRFNEVGRMPT